MVKWDDPSLLLKDFSASCILRVSQYPIDSYLVALIKLYHAIGGIYMYVHLHEPPQRKWELISTWENFSWETVITAGFPSERLQCVLRSLSVNNTLDRHLAALNKLNHVIAGLYMCVRLRIQEPDAYIN